MCLKKIGLVVQNLIIKQLYYRIAYCLEQNKQFEIPLKMQNVIMHCYFPNTPTLPRKTNYLPSFCLGEAIQILKEITDKVL